MVPCGKEGNENPTCKLFQLSLNDAFRSTVSLQGWNSVTTIMKAMRLPCLVALFKSLVATSSGVTPTICGLATIGST
jgi:hypothetical protein